MAAGGGYLIARGPDPARALLRAGRWDDALAALPVTLAVTLAAELPPGAEASQFRETALLTATELQLTWLLSAW